MTYLNKSSRYTISVEDTLRTELSPGKKIYYTSVQVVFDTERQRQQPLSFWQLWEQTRNHDECSAKGRSHAIEYLNPREAGHQDHVANLQVVHSDGFSLMWSADHDNKGAFIIPFRLNFRSTDFSHCKGVIGAAMRLCSRTEEISTSSAEFLHPDLAMSFCRIKTFRSHGAERKNVNDKAIAEKRIRRLKHHLAQSQTRQTPKDKRLGRDTSKRSRPPGARSYHENGLICKIKGLQQVCTSTQPHTSFDDQEEKQQDCDWPSSSHENTSPVSPDDMTLKPKNSISSSEPIPRPSLPLTWYNEPQERSPLRSLPERIQNLSVRQEGIKVAHFYIRQADSSRLSQNNDFIAIYLCERTACDLTGKIAAAVSVDPSLVGQLFWSTVKGLKILVDDDVVANMPEGQKMQVEARTVAPRRKEDHSPRQSEVDPTNEVDRGEHQVSHSTREMVDFNLIFL